MAASMLPCSLPGRLGSHRDLAQRSIFPRTHVLRLPRSKGDYFPVISCSFDVFSAGASWPENAMCCRDSATYIGDSSVMLCMTKHFKRHLH